MNIKEDIESIENILIEGREYIDKGDPVHELHLRGRFQWNLCARR